MSKPVNISGSRAAAILGQSSYRTPVQTWLEIMESRQPGFAASRGYELPTFEETAQIRWGRAFESAIIELAERNNQDLGGICNREKLFERSLNVKKCKAGTGILTCHLDGEYVLINRKKNPIHEGKTTSLFYYKDNFGEPGSDEIPIEYQLQCQHELICTGAEKVILSVLVFPKRVDEWEEMGYFFTKMSDGSYQLARAYPNEGAIQILDIMKWAEVLNEQGYFHQYNITRNEELQSLMLKKYSDFWNNHVLTGIEPAVQNYDDIKLLCPTASGVIISTEEIERLSAEYKNINDEIGHSGQLFKRKEMLRLEILKYMREQDKRMEKILDEDAINKFVLRDRTGRKLFQYDGKVFR